MKGRWFTWAARSCLRALLCGWASLGTATIAMAAAAQMPQPSQYDVEAAYLFNFGKFVRWPASDTGGTGQFQICILGEDPFGTVLQHLVSGERLNGRPAAIVHLKGIAEARSCAVLYINVQQEPHLGQIESVLKGTSVLTVSDIPSFLQRGGDIQFVVSQSRVRFSVNVEAASRARLSFSSELLKVAQNVIGSPAQEVGR